jgi:mono/diheme cytochrome c family protein
MDVGILHTHTLLVTLYLLQLGVKTGLLTAGKHEVLNSFSSKIRIPSIVISALMLVTGIALMFLSPVGFEPFVLVKLAIVLASIPLGIIGLKKLSIPLTMLSFLFTVGAMTLAYAKPSFLRAGGAVEVSAESPEEQAVLADGKALYEQKCKLCHGADGAAGFQGAKNLKLSVMDDAQIKSIIRNGKGMMPAERDFSDADVDKVVAYVKKLRK